MGRESIRMTGCDIYLSQKVISNANQGCWAKLSSDETCISCCCKVFAAASPLLKGATCALSRMLNRLLLMQKEIALPLLRLHASPCSSWAWWSIAAMQCNLLELPVLCRPGSAHSTGSPPCVSFLWGSFSLALLSRL